jgi:hypothetical protein
MRCGRLTEKLLATVSIFDDFNQTRLQLLNRGNVVGKDAHLARFCWNIDLHDILRFVDRL